MGFNCKFTDDTGTRRTGAVLAFASQDFTNSSGSYKTLAVAIIKVDSVEMLFVVPVANITVTPCYFGSEPWEPSDATSAA